MVGGRIVDLKKNVLGFSDFCFVLFLLFAHFEKLIGPPYSGFKQYFMIFVGLLSRTHSKTSWIIVTFIYCYTLRVWEKLRGENRKTIK